MRILVVSDLFPPLGLGGYEVAAAEVAAALRERGHEVHILTTDWGGPSSSVEPGVHRALHSRLMVGPAPSALRLLRWERDDDRAVREHLALSSPDVIFVWNVGGVSHRVLAHILNGPVPAVVYVFGDWPLRKFLAPHDLDPWTSRFAARDEPAVPQLARAAAAACTRFLGAPAEAQPLRFNHLQFGSRFLRDRFHAGGLRAARSERVIYYGLFGRFARTAAERRVPRAGGPLRVLFVGRLWEAKGVHTLVEALGRLGPDREATLTIAGPAEHPEYGEMLRRLAGDCGIADRVTWLGAVERERLLDVYASHDVLVFPSTYEEPFGIVQLEAMAAGCAVVGTGTGGSAEILEPDVNALRFPAGDAVALAAQLDRLAGDPALVARLGTAGKDTVQRRFVGARMVDEVAAHLAAVAAQRGT